VRSPLRRARAVGCWGMGMKKIFSILAVFIGVTTAAYAADMPVKAPGAPAAYNWSGCYLGGEGGGSWGRSQQIATAGAFSGLPINGGFDVTGAIAGFTFGCNLQYNNIVFGIEDDVFWTNLHGSAPDQPPFNAAATNQTKVDWVNTVRPRIGYAFDRFLVYGTAASRSPERKSKSPFPRLAPSSTTRTAAAGLPAPAPNGPPGPGSLWTSP
jgi:outer membrane immunogenic protein